MYVGVDLHALEDAEGRKEGEKGNRQMCVCMCQCHVNVAASA